MPRRAVPLGTTSEFVPRSMVATWDPYVDFLMPGVFVPVAVFGAMNTAIGLPTDYQTGILERLRHLRGDARSACTTAPN